jgi:hypothetical protein
MEEKQGIVYAFCSFSGYPVSAAFDHFTAPGERFYGVAPEISKIRWLSTDKIIKRSHG